MSHYSPGLLFKKGIEDEPFDYDKGLDAIIESDITGFWLYKAGTDWETINYDKAFEALLQKDKGGIYIIKAGSSWKKFDHERALIKLAELDKEGYLIAYAIIEWKLSNEQYARLLDILAKLNIPDDILRCLARIFLDKGVKLPTNNRIVNSLVYLE